MPTEAKNVMTTASRSDDWIENRPTTGFRWPDPRELWAFRELAAFLALRDLKVRYKQAVFGAAWAILQPIAGVVVFTIVFERFGHVPSEGIPYPVFSFVGLAVWSYTSASVTRATQSLVTNSALVTKVYFPRLLAPLAAVLPAVPDFLLSLVMLAVLLPIYHVVPTVAILTLPVWLVLLVVAALGVGLWLGSLNVTYRDINQAVVLLIQFWMFLTPVAYPSTSVPAAWRPLYFMNPMAGVVEGFRWALIGLPWPGPYVFISVASSIVLLVTGIMYFERTERRFADVI
jgi:lipopolysaccharide transport system permease protein